VSVGLGVWEALRVCVVVGDVVNEDDIVRVGGSCRVGVPDNERLAEGVRLSSIDKLSVIDIESEPLFVVEVDCVRRWLLLELRDAVIDVDADDVNEASALALLVVDVEFDILREVDVVRVCAVLEGEIERLWAELKLSADDTLCVCELLSDAAELSDSVVVCETVAVAECDGALLALEVMSSETADECELVFEKDESAVADWFERVAALKGDTKADAVWGSEKEGPPHRRQMQKEYMGCDVSAAPSFQPALSPLIYVTPSCFSAPLLGSPMAQKQVPGLAQLLLLLKKTGTPSIPFEAFLNGCSVQRKVTLSPRVLPPKAA
jgi:hypothetical protein